MDIEIEPHEQEIINLATLMRAACDNFVVDQHLSRDARFDWELKNADSDAASHEDDDDKWIEVGWRKLARAALLYSMHQKLPPAEAKADGAGERLVDHSAALAHARRELRRRLLALNDNILTDQYYETLTLSEHEAARRALLAATPSNGEIYDAIKIIERLAAAPSPPTGTVSEGDDAVRMAAKIIGIQFPQTPFDILMSVAQAALTAAASVRAKTKGATRP